MKPSAIFKPLFIVGVAAVFGFPFFWMVITSLKSSAELTTNPNQLWPTAWDFGNYNSAVTNMPWLQYLANSIILAMGSVIGTLFSCSLAAYAFARLHWPGREIVFGLLIATMLLPWQATMVPQFLIIRELGLYNSLAALILPTFFGNAFYIFLLRQFFKSVPEELLDAARLEGCSEIGIFFRIVVPLAKPAIITVGLFQFIASWNDYGGPLLYLSDPEKFPLAYGLEQFVSAHSSQTHLLMAAAVLFTLPVIVMFFFAQRSFTHGISAGGVKG